MYNNKVNKLWYISYKGILYSYLNELIKTMWISQIWFKQNQPGTE